MRLFDFVDFKEKEKEPKLIGKYAKRYGKILNHCSLNIQSSAWIVSFISWTNKHTSYIMQTTALQDPIHWIDVSHLRKRSVYCIWFLSFSAYFFSTCFWLLLLLLFCQCHSSVYFFYIFVLISYGVTSNFLNCILPYSLASILHTCI